MNEPRITPLSLDNLDIDAAEVLQPMIDAGRPWEYIPYPSQTPRPC